MEAALLDLLASSKASAIVAPAGCGKTESIVRALKAQDAHTLVLTHTNAGVRSIRGRMRRLDCSGRIATVSTLDSWVLRLVSSFPLLAGLRAAQDAEDVDWEHFRQAAWVLLGNSNIVDFIRTSYSAVIVDEYQDCDVWQHRIVVELAKHLPCVVLGDPLQAIFQFASPVDWDSDVRASFNEYRPDVTPWRWRATNPELGEWLLHARRIIESNLRLDLAAGPLLLVPDGTALAWKWAVPRETVALLRRFPAQCDRVVRRLSGHYSIHEEVALSGLAPLFRAEEAGAGPLAEEAVVSFLAACYTKASFITELNARRNSDAGRARSLRGKHAHTAEVLEELRAEAGPATLLTALLRLSTIVQAEGGRLVRHSLWSAAQRVLTIAAASDQTLTGATRAYRSAKRFSAAKPHPRLVSRTLLSKGLEYDRVIVMDFHEMGSQDRYVALTRCRRMLAVEQQA